MTPSIHDPIDSELQIILHNFANRPEVGGINSVAYQSLEHALLSSSYLADQNNLAVAEGHLKLKYSWSQL